MAKHRQQPGIVPFGKYKGKPYEEVPASYFAFLRRKPWIRDWPDLYTYICRNWAKIDQEQQEFEDQAAFFREPSDENKPKPNKRRSQATRADTPEPDAPT